MYILVSKIVFGLEFYSGRFTRASESAMLFSYPLYVWVTQNPAELTKGGIFGTCKQKTRRN